MIIFKSAGRSCATSRLRRGHHRTTFHISGSARLRHKHTAHHNAIRKRAPGPLCPLVFLPRPSRASHPAGRACTSRGLRVPHCQWLQSPKLLRNRWKQRRAPGPGQRLNLPLSLRPGLQNGRGHWRDQPRQRNSSAVLPNDCYERIEAPWPQRRGNVCRSRQHGFHTDKSERLHPFPRKTSPRFRNRTADGSAGKDARRLFPAGRAIPPGLCKGVSPQGNCSEPCSSSSVVVTSCNGT